ncbi:hypothetical protein KCH_63180 [Kitasatospora cheerisanensis KCTC 2395]|uniref:Uncharacterized protein n=1 Tax=Kitasatospora cheerisanensis KCTC 2395 TaxID=1348663 RepID=A0A066YPH2_9ACTN|nr:hypothetical protein KCH_63180 [Kitasatospora cheerisanensis KCTC 2395]
MRTVAWRNLTRRHRVVKHRRHESRHLPGLPPARRPATPGERHVCLLTLPA